MDDSNINTSSEENVNYYPQEEFIPKQEDAPQPPGNAPQPQGFVQAYPIYDTSPQSQDQQIIDPST